MCECRSPPGVGVGRSRPLRALRIAERYRRRRGRGFSLRGKNWLEPPPLAADDGLAAVEVGGDRLQLAPHGARGVAGGTAPLPGGLQERKGGGQGKRWYRSVNTGGNGIH